jgi:hypothetical protein
MTKEQKAEGCYTFWRRHLKQQAAETFCRDGVRAFKNHKRSWWS